MTTLLQLSRCRIQERTHRSGSRIEKIASCSAERVGLGSLGPCFLFLSPHPSRNSPISMSRQIRPYWDFLAAVQAVQRSWEAISPTFSPGWTPAEWAEDLTGLITASIWNQEHAPLHERIISMLEKRRNPDICSGNFVRFDSLAPLPRSRLM